MKIRSFKYVLLCVAVCGIMQRPTPAAPQIVPQARMTREQAIQAAEAFCKASNIAVTVPVMATFPAMDLVPEAPSSWQSRWQVTFANQVKLQVIDATGSISELKNYNTPGRSRGKTPPGDAISKLDAVNIARDLMRTSGHLSELGTPVAYEQQTSEPPTWEEHVWLVCFPRIYKSVSYKDQQANISLQAETGEPIGFSINFISPAPEPALMRLDKVTATSAASALIDKSLAAGAAFTKIRTEIVQPNTFWEPNGSDKQKVGKVRPAQVVTFKAGNDNVEVWLDAETGGVIGGVQTGTLSGEASSRTSSPRTGSSLVYDDLETATEIRIYRRAEDNPGWHLAPALVTNKQFQPELFRLFRMTGHGTGEKYRPTQSQYKLVTVSSQGVRKEHIYDSGYVGGPEHWLRLPSSLQSELETKLFTSVSK